MEQPMFTIFVIYLDEHWWYMCTYIRVYIGFLQTLRRDAGEITIRTINIIRFKDRPQ